MYKSEDKKRIDKHTFVAMAGDLLRETRAGSDIDHIFLADEETAEVAYKDRRRMRKRVNIAHICNMEILKELIEAIE